METRIALIGIIVENPESIEALNHLLHEYGKYIIGRMGIPYREREVNIISVAIDAPQDVINALSGKIGRLDGTGKIISLRCKPSQLESAALLLAVGLSHNKDNEKPCPFGIRCATSRASSNPLCSFSLLGLSPNKNKKKR